MRIRLPALKGDDPLGFLAALGLISLSEMEEISPLRLSWGDASTPIAFVEGDVGSVEALGSELSNTLEKLKSAKGVIPRITPDFPPEKRGSTDPMRMTTQKMADHYQSAHNDWCLKGAHWFARWLVALAAQSSVKDTKRGDVELTPFYAPTGQMAMRTSIFEKTVEAVDKVDGPADALTSWSHVAYDGANFDERAKRDAAVTTSGDADNKGAPSATWLAAMGMRFFPMVDYGRNTRTVGWQRVRLYPGYTNRSLIWPVWGPFFDAAAVRTVISMPELELKKQGDKWVLIRGDLLSRYGITAVFGASRRTLSQGDGPIGPAVKIWPTNE